LKSVQLRTPSMHTAERSRWKGKMDLPLSVVFYPTSSARQGLILERSAHYRVLRNYLYTNTMIYSAAVTSTSSRPIPPSSLSHFILESRLQVEDLSILHVRGTPYFDNIAVVKSALSMFNPRVPSLISSGVELASEYSWAPHALNGRSADDLPATLTALM
jgi:hypothetical protein